MLFCDPYGLHTHDTSSSRLDASLDLSSFASVQEFASSMDRPIDLLVCQLASRADGKGAYIELVVSKQKL